MPASVGSDWSGQRLSFLTQKGGLCAQEEAGAALQDPDLTATLGHLNEAALEVLQPSSLGHFEADAAAAAVEGANAGSNQDSKKQLALVSRSAFP